MDRLQTHATTPMATIVAMSTPLKSLSHSPGSVSMFSSVRFDLLVFVVRRHCRDEQCQGEADHDAEAEAGDEQQRSGHDASSRVVRAVVSSTSVSTNR